MNTENQDARGQPTGDCWKMPTLTRFLTCLLKERIISPKQYTESMAEVFRAMASTNHPLH